MLPVRSHIGSYTPKQVVPRARHAARASVSDAYLCLVSSIMSSAHCMDKCLVGQSSVALVQSVSNVQITASGSSVVVEDCSTIGPPVVDVCSASGSPVVLVVAGDIAVWPTEGDKNEE